MPKKSKPQSSLLVFQGRFPDDQHCAEFLFERRWPEGFVCPKCESGRAALLRSRAWTYKCLDCGRQTSVTAGTVMHRTKLRSPLGSGRRTSWRRIPTGMSALQLKGQLGISYRAAWLLTQKLRCSMVDPDREPRSRASSKSTRPRCRSATARAISAPTRPAKSSSSAPLKSMTAPDGRRKSL